VRRNPAGFNSNLRDTQICAAMSCHHRKRLLAGFLDRNFVRHERISQGCDDQICVVPPPRFDFRKLNKQLVLNWTNAGFNLQSAPAVTGTFTNIPGATSPYTNSLAVPQKFFRLISN
jgi:hypothetical protein